MRPSWSRAPFTPEERHPKSWLRGIWRGFARVNNTSGGILHAPICCEGANKAIVPNRYLIFKKIEPWDLKKFGACLECWAVLADVVCPPFYSIIGGLINDRRS